ncbi:MAG: hypothetical protein HYX78_06485 [Armatimonadetes bacterium]|nr:hypothetical protein [Armatimonadota bacterium]
MQTNDEFTQYYSELLEGAYDCVDRSINKKVMDEAGERGCKFSADVVAAMESAAKMLEKAKSEKLGKPIHIESQCASAEGPMPGCRHFPDGHPGQVYVTWHRQWDEDLQAEWLEKMFIVCLSKDYVTEWNWWDLADYEDCYYPWGGLLDKDYKPKKSYFKLEELVKRWGGRLM